MHYIPAILEGVSITRRKTILPPTSLSQNNINNDTVVINTENNTIFKNLCFWEVENVGGIV